MRRDIGLALLGVGVASQATLLYADEFWPPPEDYGPECPWTLIDCKEHCSASGIEDFLCFDEPETGLWYGYCLCY